MNLLRARPRFLAAWSHLAASLVLVAGAGAATLTGSLVDRDTHRPVEFASVRLLETGRAQRSDASGHFTFSALAPGSYTLSTHHMAYADIERPVRVGEQGDSVVVLLGPALYHTGEIVVRSTRSVSPLASTPWAADEASEEQIRELPAITMSEAVDRLPGLALSRDGEWETALSIRGLGRSNVVALVDNTRIETSTDISGGLSLINPQDLERVEVMKSSGSVLFGSGSLGGAVQMVTRRASFSDQERFGAEWTTGATSVDRGISHYVAAEQTGAGHALRVSGGFRNASVTRTPIGEMPNSQFRDYSGTASLGLRTIGAQSLTASYQRMQAEDTGIPGGAAFTPTAKVTYPMARRELFGLDYAIPNLSRFLPLVTARLARQEIARDVEVVQTPTLTLTPHATHLTHSGQLEARIAPGGEHLLIVGAELWHRGVESLRERRFATTPSKIIGERPIPRSAYMSGGIYAQDDWSVVPDRVRAVFGARYDRSRTHNDQTLNPDYLIVGGVLQPLTLGINQALQAPSTTAYDHSWSANTGLHVAVARHVALSVLLATAFRSPSLEERYQFLDLGSSLHVGNPGLKPEQSVSLNASGQLNLERTHFEVDAFGNRLTDLVAEIPGTFEGRRTNVFVKTNIGKARLYGLEASGEQRVASGLAFKGSVAYVRGEDTYHHANLPQIAPLTGQAELAFDAFKRGTLRLTCTAAHTQGNPAAGEARTPGYADFGWNFSSTPLPLGGTSVRLRAGIENVFDRAYRLHLSTLRGLINEEPGRNYFVSATFAL